MKLSVWFVTPIWPGRAADKALREEAQDRSHSKPDEVPFPGVDQFTELRPPADVT